jgi:hypothetical protein
MSKCVAVFHLAMCYKLFASTMPLSWALLDIWPSCCYFCRKRELNLPGIALTDLFDYMFVYVWSPPRAVLLEFLIYGMSAYVFTCSPLVLLCYNLNLSYARNFLILLNSVILLLCDSLFCLCIFSHFHLQHLIAVLCYVYLTQLHCTQLYFKHIVKLLIPCMRLSCILRTATARVTLFIIVITEPIIAIYIVDVVYDHQ